MNINQLVTQFMSHLPAILALIGSALIVVGLLKFFGVHINIVRGSGLEIAVAGYLLKALLCFPRPAAQ